MPSFTDINTLRMRLRDIEEALSAAASGSSYSIGGRTLTRQTFDDLRSERTRLMREIKRSQAAAAGVENPSSAVATWV